MAELGTAALVSAPTPSTSRPLSEWPDEQLIGAVAQGDGKAHGELRRRYRALVAGAARTILGGSEGVEEVVADAFIGLWEHPDRFDPRRGSLAGYLRQQARRRSIDLLRSESARAQRERRYAQEADREAANSPEQELMLSATATPIRAAVSALPEKERAAVDLAFFGGLTYRDVALRLGLPEGTVKGRIRNAMARMRDTLAENWDGPSLPSATAVTT